MAFYKVLSALPYSRFFLEYLCLYLDTENGIMVYNVRVSYLLFAEDLVLFSESKSGVQKLLYGLRNFLSTMANDGEPE